jgi:hypothetical protein
MVKYADDVLDHLYSQYWARCCTDDDYDDNNI